MPESTFIDERILHSGMMGQLQSWRNVLESGHKHLGWKIGFNTRSDQQRIGIKKPLVGYLTSEGLVETGGVYRCKTNSKTLVEAELAILIGQDIPATADSSQIRKSIKAFAPALEIVDVTNVSSDVEAMLKGNLFHETVILGEAFSGFDSLTASDIYAEVMVNGEAVASSDYERYPDNFLDFVEVVVATLAEHGEQLKTGDWIITGSLIKPFAISAGDRVTLSMPMLSKNEVDVNIE